MSNEAKNPQKLAQAGCIYKDNYNDANFQNTGVYEIKDAEQIYEGMPVVMNDDGTISTVSAATDVIRGVLMDASKDAEEGRIARGHFITVQTSMSAGATLDMTHPLMVDPTTKMWISYDAGKASSCIQTLAMPDADAGNKVVAGRMKNFCEPYIFLECNVIYAFVPEIINIQAGTSAASGGASSDSSTTTQSTAAKVASVKSTTKA